MCLDIPCYRVPEFHWRVWEVRAGPPFLRPLEQSWAPCQFCILQVDTGTPKPLLRCRRPVDRCPRSPTPKMPIPKRTFAKLGWVSRSGPHVALHAASRPLSLSVLPRRSTVLLGLRLPSAAAQTTSCCPPAVQNHRLPGRHSLMKLTLQAVQSFTGVTTAHSCALQNAHPWRTCSIFTLPVTAS